MSSVLSQLPDLGNRLLPFTLDQYHRMIKEGILLEGSPYELIGGYLVRKDRSARGANPMTVGNEHAYTVGKIADWNTKLKSIGCFVRSQQPVSIPPQDEPEPDAAIVRGRAEDYRSHHPAPADVICAIEVAESSLRYDRTIKAPLYARSGIPMYVIVNLPDRTVEVHTEPKGQKYRHNETLRASGKLTIIGPTGKRRMLPVRSILP